jgi:hypothetical protein
MRQAQGPCSLQCHCQEECQPQWQDCSCWMQGVGHLAKRYTPCLAWMLCGMLSIVTNSW